MFEVSSSSYFLWQKAGISWEAFPDLVKEPFSQPLIRKTTEEISFHCEDFRRSVTPVIGIDQFSLAGFQGKAGKLLPFSIQDMQKGAGGLQKHLGVGSLIGSCWNCVPVSMVENRIVLSYTVGNSRAAGQGKRLKRLKVFLFNEPLHMRHQKRVSVYFGIGGSLQPLQAFLIEIFKVGIKPSMEKVVFDILHSVFNLPLALWVGLPAHVNLELPLALIPQKFMGEDQLSVVLVFQKDRVLIKNQYPGYAAKISEGLFQGEDPKLGGYRLIREYEKFLPAA